MTATSTRSRLVNPRGTARQGLARTSRRDAWWLVPGIIATGFGAFIAYSLFSALVWYPLFGVEYEVDGYLSPFFSPLMFENVLPVWISPAIFILWIPLGFRTTCYYYRKAYYRSYFADPPACAVSGITPLLTGFSLRSIRLSPPTTNMIRASRNQPLRYSGDGPLSSGAKG